MNKDKTCHCYISQPSIQKPNYSCHHSLFFFQIQLNRSPTLGNAGRERLAPTEMYCSQSWLRVGNTRDLALSDLTAPSIVFFFMGRILIMCWALPLCPFLFLSHAQLSRCPVLQFLVTECTTAPDIIAREQELSRVTTVQRNNTHNSMW